MSEVKEETAPALRSTRVPVGSAVYNSVVEFLYEEACMLDEIRLKDWAATLA